MNAETPNFWTDTSAGVPAVEPQDLDAVWKFMREVAERVQGQHSSVDVRYYQRLCSPGANIQAVWFRASMLGMLDMAVPGWTENRDSDKVIALAARFPMKKMEAGITCDGPPFDLPEFLKQIAAV